MLITVRATVRDNKLVFQRRVIPNDKGTLKKGWKKNVKSGESCRGPPQTNLIIPNDLPNVAIGLEIDNTPRGEFIQGSCTRSVPKKGGRGINRFIVHCGGRESCQFSSHRGGK